MKKRAVVLQSGGSTAVINQSLVGVIEGVKQSKSFSQLYGSHYGIMGVLQDRWSSLASLSSTELQRLKQTPSSALGSCRLKLSRADGVSIVRTLQKKKIDAIFLIGGNDSSETGLLLARTAATLRYPLQVLGIPKTIDNDLCGMDHTPGYGSVAKFMAITTQEATLDTRAMPHSDPIKIIETMGRNSGWIVAAASLGKRKPEDGPHLLYFPERPVSENQFVEDVHAVYRRLGFAVIVISETIRDAKGKRIGAPKKYVQKDQFGHAYVEGTAHHLCNLVESKLHVRARFDKPGTIQRMAMGYISKTDQREAYQCGRHAVRLASQGKTGVMVTIERRSSKPYRVSFGDMPLAKVAGREKPLPDAFIHKSNTAMSEAFRRYALPLIDGDIPKFTFLGPRPMPLKKR